jgi:phage tail-like protein
MSDTYYPPPAFRFTVTLIGSGTALFLATRIDASFEEISGIEAKFDTEDVVEGGENRFVHRLPKATRYPPLVMKRGLVTKNSALAEWVGQTVGSRLSLPIIPQNMLVTLLDESDDPLVCWGFTNVYPLRVVTAPLNSMENKILTETMEFSYNYYERVTFGGLASAVVKMAELAANLAGA